MVDQQIINQIIEILLTRITTEDQELGRFLIHDQYDNLDSRIVFWAIREKTRDLKETTLTDLEDFSDIEVKLTLSPRGFFEDVLKGKNVPYWQVATVMRLLQSSDIIYDPRGKLDDWKSQAEHVEWQPEVIDLKRQTARMLLGRVKNRIQEDMIADAYIWLIKAAEEAICIPLMNQNAFGLGTAPFLLDSLRNADLNLYDFFNQLLRISHFNPARLSNARQELELLADRLFQQHLRTDREMWILSAFVSINESELRLNQSMDIRNNGKTVSVASRLFETAVGELWQAFFLVAQSPRLDVKLDPWVVASFWTWFGGTEINEEWLEDKMTFINTLIES
ncbi:hypothetical protein CEE45_04685 [Candidatus Heimdallarchaeota archaeon B3_Heim]|nr:MAG: hypothetical protein CEE45_04685 [Candidatus Heimdallarchaeota archaeon B3_Heim]